MVLSFPLPIFHKWWTNSKINASFQRLLHLFAKLIFSPLLITGYVSVNKNWREKRRYIIAKVFNLWRWTFVSHNSTRVTRKERRKTQRENSLSIFDSLKALSLFWNLLYRLQYELITNWKLFAIFLFWQ